MERKIEEYRIVRTDVDNLGDRVKDKIRQGWQPFGAPYTYRGIMAQAMVKYTDEDLEAIYGEVGRTINLSELAPYYETGQKSERREPTELEIRDAHIDSLTVDLKEAAKLSHRYRDETGRLKVLLEETENAKIVAVGDAVMVMEDFRADNDQLRAEAEKLSTVIAGRGVEIERLAGQVDKYIELAAEENPTGVVGLVLADVWAENGALKVEARSFAKEANKENLRLTNCITLITKNFNTLKSSTDGIRNRIETERDTLKISFDVLVEAVMQNHCGLDVKCPEDPACDMCGAIKEFKADRG
jgi:hypothetical protein